MFFHIIIDSMSEILNGKFVITAVFVENSNSGIIIRFSNLAVCLGNILCLKKCLFTTKGPALTRNFLICFLERFI